MAAARIVNAIKASRPLNLCPDAAAESSVMPIARTPRSSASSASPAWSGPRKARRIPSRS